MRGQCGKDLQRVLLPFCARLGAARALDHHRRPPVGRRAGLALHHGPRPSAQVILRDSSPSSARAADATSRPPSIRDASAALEIRDRIVDRFMIILPSFVAAAGYRQRMSWWPIASARVAPRVQSGNGGTPRTAGTAMSGNNSRVARRMESAWRTTLGTADRRCIAIQTRTFHGGSTPDPPRTRGESSDSRAATTTAGRPARA